MVRIVVIAVSLCGFLAAAGLGLYGETIDTSVTESDQNLVQNGAAAVAMLSVGPLILLAVIWMVPRAVREIRRTGRRQP